MPRLRIIGALVALLLALSACGSSDPPAATLPESFTLNGQAVPDDPRIRIIDYAAAGTPQPDETYTGKLLESSAQPHPAGPVIVTYDDLPFSVRALSLSERATTAFNERRTRGEPFNLLQGGYLVPTQETSPRRINFDHFSDPWLYLERQSDGSLVAVIFVASGYSWRTAVIQTTCEPREASPHCLYLAYPNAGPDTVDGGNLILVAPVDYVTFDLPRDTEDDGRWTGTDFVLRWNDTHLTFRTFPHLPDNLREYGVETSIEELAGIFAAGGRAIGGLELAKLPTYSPRKD